MKNVKSKNTLWINKILFFIIVFTFSINFSFSSEDRSGVIRGGFIIDNTGKTQQQAEVKKEKTTNQTNTSQSSQTERNNVNTTTEVQSTNREQVKKQNNSTTASNSGDVKKKPEQRTNTVQNEDEIDYKKIYFMLISALILFVYLIFGLKKRGKRRSSGASSNRYLR